MGIIISTILLDHHVFLLCLRLLSFHRSKFCLLGKNRSTLVLCYGFETLLKSCNDNFPDHRQISQDHPLFFQHYSSLFHISFHPIITQFVRGNFALIKFILCQFILGTSPLFFFASARFLLLLFTLFYCLGVTYFTYILCFYVDFTNCSASTSKMPLSFTDF